MNLTDDDILKCQFGIPILFDDVCAIYPATLREIAEVGYSQFQKFLSLLTIEKPVEIDKANTQLKEIFTNMTDFEYLLSLTIFDPSLSSTLQQAFKFFTHEDVYFLMEPPEIVVGPPEEKHIINDSNFHDFQKILKKMYFLEIDEDEIIINADDSPPVKRIKMQMKIGREKVKRAKMKANNEKSDLKFSDLIGSLPLNNCGLNLTNIQNLTYYAFHDQLRRMGWRDQFNFNHQAALAGAKIKKEEMKHWIRTISSDK